MDSALRLPEKPRVFFEFFFFFTFSQPQTRTGHLCPCHWLLCVRPCKLSVFLLGSWKSEKFFWHCFCFLLHVNVSSPMHLASERVSKFPLDRLGGSYAYLLLNSFFFGFILLERAENEWMRDLESLVTGSPGFIFYFRLRLFPSAGWAHRTPFS